MGGRPPRVTATLAKSTKRPREENEGSRAGERRRWDFDRPLAPASQAGGRTNESSKERVPVLARPCRCSTSTLCAACTASATVGLHPAWLAWLACRTRHPIPNPSRGGAARGNQIGLGLECTVVRLVHLKPCVRDTRNRSEISDEERIDQLYWLNRSHVILINSFSI